MPKLGLQAPNGPAFLSGLLALPWALLPTGPPPMVSTPVPIAPPVSAPGAPVVLMPKMSVPSLRLNPPE